MSTGAWVSRKLPLPFLPFLQPTCVLGTPSLRSPGLRPTAPLYFPVPGSSACHSISVSPPAWGARKLHHISQPHQALWPRSINQAGWRAPGLEGQARESRRGCRGESRFSYPTRRCLVQSSWTGASGPREQQEWAEPVGGTDIWQRRGSQAWSLWGRRGWGKGRVSGRVGVG